MTKNSFVEDVVSNENEMMQNRTYVDDGNAIATLKGGSEYEISKFVWRVAKEAGVVLNWHRPYTLAIVLCYAKQEEERKRVASLVKHYENSFVGTVSIIGTH